MKIGERALGELDKHRTPETGHNAGEPVEWSCKRWLSAQRYEQELAAGKLEWCAGAVCSAFDDAGSTQIHEVVSLSCNELLKHCVGHGYIVPRDEIEVGDIVWTDRDGDGKPNHVGIASAVERDSAGIVRLVLRSGNSGPKADRVTDRAYLFDRRILCAARLEG
jgi:hypothetical protein